MGMEALGALLGGVGVVVAALAVFAGGPPLLTRAARSLGIGGLAVGGAGSLQHLMANGFKLDMSQRGGPGLFASAGLLLFTFGAARVAERRRAERDRARFMAERAASRKVDPAP